MKGRVRHLLIKVRSQSTSMGSQEVKNLPRLNGRKVLPEVYRNGCVLILIWRATEQENGRFRSEGWSVRIWTWAGTYSQESLETIALNAGYAKWKRRQFAQFLHRVSLRTLAGEKCLFNAFSNMLSWQVAKMFLELLR